MSKVNVIVGAGSGFGTPAAGGVARAGHTVHAAMRDTRRCVHAERVADAVARYAAGQHADLRTVELDVLSQRLQAFEKRYAGLMDRISGRPADLTPADADASPVAEAIVKAEDTGHGKRPFRIHVDPADGASEAVSDLADRTRAEFPGRMGLDDPPAPWLDDLSAPHAAA
ncbi:hypothetical protein ACWEF9_33975 [Streptomyces sp. NPDC004980]